MNMLIRRAATLSKRAAEDIDRKFGIPLPMPKMTCDGSRVIFCKGEVKRAPRIVIPGHTEGSIGAPIRIMTPLHFCDACLLARPFDVQAYLDAPGQRARIERGAHSLRGAGFRPDFERARLETLLVTTPEYRVWFYQGMRHVS